MKKQRNFRRKKVSVTEVSLVPLVDTALTLLIVFMIATPVVHHRIKVQLPSGVSQDPHEKERFVVTLDKDGQWFLNNDPIEGDTLLARVRKKVGEDSSFPVCINADKGQSYGTVLSMVDGLKDAGVRFVSMTTVSQKKNAIKKT